MNIWIVEDDETYALKAAKAAVQAVEATPHHGLGSIRLYWNPVVRWAGPLFAIDLNGPEPTLTEKDYSPRLTAVVPRVVVLDLFDSQLDFTARDFLLALRKWEFDNKLEGAYVVLWSGWSGLKEARSFVTNEPRRDWRVRWLETKDETSLKLAIQGYLRTSAEIEFQ